MPKSPTSTKVSSSPTTPRRKKDLAAPNGAWIIRTTALKKYGLAASDLDSILPISETRNPNGGASLVRRYNECDVQALAERLRGQSSPATPYRATGLVGSSSPGASSSPAAADKSINQSRLAEKKGPRILRTRAMKEFGLKPVQMDRIKPISEEPNPHGRGAPMRYYNLCDVQALATSVTAAAATPSTPSSSRSRSSYYDDDYYDTYDNPFDGLSREDAADLFCQKTGIADISVFFCND